MRGCKNPNHKQLICSFWKEIDDTFDKTGWTLRGTLHNVLQENVFSQRFDLSFTREQGVQRKRNLSKTVPERRILPTLSDSMCKWKAGDVTASAHGILDLRTPPSFKSFPGNEGETTEHFIYRAHCHLKDRPMYFIVFNKIRLRTLSCKRIFLNREYKQKQQHRHVNCPQGSDNV